MIKPTVSFVLPAYKGDFLRSAIESILAQTYKDFELVIVNDCSPCDLKSIVMSFDDPRISYYENEENRGGIDLIGHWNSCIARSQGTFVVIASDDDAYDSHYLEEMMLLVDKYPQVDLFHCRIRYVDVNDNILQLSQPANEIETCADFVCQRLFWGRKQAAPEFMFKKTIWEKVGGMVNFPLAWYSDDATWNVFSQKGVAYSSKILLSFRMSGQNLSTIGSKCLEKIDAMKLYVEWLKVFLPQIECTSQEDEFERDLCIKNYKSIIYDHYREYLQGVPLRCIYKEIKYMRRHRIFSDRAISSMVIRRFTEF